jgi:hypothetical protein
VIEGLGYVGPTPVEIGTSKGIVRAGLREAFGRTRLDIRLFAGWEERPTKQGVSIPVSELDKIAELIAEARAYLQSHKS